MRAVRRRRIRASARREAARVKGHLHARAMASRPSAYVSSATTRARSTSTLVHAMAAAIEGASYVVGVEHDASISKLPLALYESNAPLSKLSERVVIGDHGASGATCEAKRAARNHFGSLVASLGHVRCCATIGLRSPSCLTTSRVGSSAQPRWSHACKEKTSSHDRVGEAHRAHNRAAEATCLVCVSYRGRDESYLRPAEGLDRIWPSVVTFLDANPAIAQALSIDSQALQREVDEASALELVVAP